MRNSVGLSRQIVEEETTNQTNKQSTKIIDLQEGIYHLKKQTQNWPFQRSMAMVPKDAKKKLFFTSSQDQRLTTVESTRVVRVRVCVCVCVCMCWLNMMGWFLEDVFLLFVCFLFFWKRRCFTAANSFQHLPTFTTPRSVGGGWKST